MLIEISFQVVAIRRDSENGKISKLLDILSSRILDGPNLSITAVILLYLITQQSEKFNLASFISKYKVRKANNSLIKLLEFYIFVICSLDDDQEAEEFLKSILESSSEIYPELRDKNHYFISETVVSIRSNLVPEDGVNIEKVFNSIRNNQTLSSQIKNIQNTIKKSYYSITMRVKILVHSRP